MRATRVINNESARFDGQSSSIPTAHSEKKDQIFATFASEIDIYDSKRPVARYGRSSDVCYRNRKKAEFPTKPQHFPVDSAIFFFRFTRVSRECSNVRRKSPQEPARFYRSSRRSLVRTTEKIRVGQASTPRQSNRRAINDASRVTTRRKR